MASLKVRTERQAAGRRRRRLVDRLATLSSQQLPQLSFPGLESEPLAQQIPFNSSGKTTPDSQPKQQSI